MGKAYSWPIWMLDFIPKKYFHTYLFDLATHLRKIGFPQNWPWFPLHRERERERTCSIKEISTNFMQIMGKYRENIRKEQRELILKVVPIIWFELLTLELGQGLIWHFLWINKQKATILATYEKSRIFATFKGKSGRVTTKPESSSISICLLETKCFLPEGWNTQTWL